MSHLFGENVRPRRWRKLIWMVLFVVVCVAGLIGWAFYRGNQALREAMAAASRDDPHWQMEDFESHRAVIPEAENSALHLTSVNKSFAHPSYGAQQQWYDTIDEIAPYPDVRLNDAQKTALVELLKPYEPIISQYVKVKGMPRGRYPLTISQDVVGTLLPHTQNARHVVNTLRWLAYQRIENGDVPGAADAIVAGINAGRSIGDEPFLISGLVRFACDNINVLSCERFLAHLEADDATLARLQKVIAQERDDPIFLNSMRGERGFGFAYLQYLKANPSQARSMSAMTGVGGTTWYEPWAAYVPGVVARSQVDLLNHMTEGVSIARGPYEKYGDRFKAWQDKASEMAIYAKSVAPSVVKVSEAALRHQANLRCVHAAIAAERYRLNFQKWPDKLEELVAAKLIAAVPLDPFDGMPLRWKTTDTGRVVYSVGKDMTDDGGKLVIDPTTPGAIDIGVRLYDPDKRRQPPRPPKPKEPESQP